jgi:CSLREA domain-containing protein
MSARSLRRSHARALVDERRRDARRGRRAGLAAGVAIGATALFAPSANAATFQVTSTADVSPSNACDTDCTLRDAIDAANADTDGNADTITFASSISGSTITLDGNELNITDPEGLTITGPGAANLIIDADHKSRHFYVNTSAPVSITGLTLQNGAFQTQKYNPSYGPNAVNGADGSNGPGGGSILTAPGSDLTVSDSVIKDNETTSSDGIYSTAASGGGILGQASDVDVVNTTITGNAADYSGGGIAVTDEF